MKALVSLRSHARLIALAVLPALLLRAFTPVGFMPMHDAHGGLYLAFCPGLGDTLLPPAPYDAHRGHHAPHDHNAMHDHGAMHDHAASTSAAGTRDEPAPQHHDLCPYALSAGPALAYAAPDIPASAPHIAVAPAPDYSSVRLPTIERAQGARAPPAPRIA